MTELLAVLVVTFLTALSPGADFAMLTKNTYLYGRKAGMMTNLGISIGVLFHVSYTLLAVATVMMYAPDLFVVVKYIGAVYLIYMGYKTFKQGVVSGDDTVVPLSAKKALSYGFLCSATNPKTMLLVVAVFTQVASATTPQTVLIGYGFMMAAIDFAWYAIIVTIFSIPNLRERMLKKQVAINRAIGSILGLIGGSLIFSSM